VTTPGPTSTVVGIDHVQLAMPAGPEAEARAGAFYTDLLGLPRVPKPPQLAARGGCWFELGPARVHLGVEEDFRPARKAHPALVVSGLDALVKRLDASGHPTRQTEDVPGRPQWYVDDPFGNRIELLPG
jgi:catechol 2,3-dioxygenase-like lactoylglutathione lyase family enzyme